jgi:hypothetical protein
MKRSFLMVRARIIHAMYRGRWPRATRIQLGTPTESANQSRPPRGCCLTAERLTYPATVPYPRFRVPGPAAKRYEGPNVKEETRLC